MITPPIKRVVMPHDVCQTNCKDLSRAWNLISNTFEKFCPKAPVQIETISGFNVEFPYLERDFWSAYPKARASALASFVALARRGKPHPTFKPREDEEHEKAVQRYQKEDVERSVKYCKEVLGLGIRQS